MPRQIQGSQRDFSYGEVDIDLKRADEHPARKAGLRQMSNARIRNSGTMQNRSGRSALYPVTDGGTRTERFTIAPGYTFDIQFAPGRLKIIDATGATVGNFAVQANGAMLPWASAQNINTIRYAILNQSIYIAYLNMRPQVVTWDGAAAWTIADYTELLINSQKRAAFYRISPQGITIQPSSQSGTVNVISNAALFTPNWVGTRIRYINRQILITGYTSPTAVAALVEETLPGSQTITFATDPTPTFSVGDEALGATSGAKGIVTAVNAGPKTIVVQLLSNLGTVVPGQLTGVFAFLPVEVVAGPGGSATSSAASSIQNAPQAVAIWDEEVMNNFRGYPASCFVDQFRLGFCNFPSVPGGIGWSAINSPTDMYVGANPSDAMFELAPSKVQVFDVVPGPESSEFVFCDRRIYYIPISPTNPLKPGSVAFNILSGDGSAPVQPRLAQEVILYSNAGQTDMMAIVASGAYYRPFNTKNLTDLHGHLFDRIVAIAAPNADGTFNERYAYVLNASGSVVVGKYNPESLQTSSPVIGWGPWSGVGAVSWVAAWAADVLFTSSYFGAGIVEILDDAQYLDASLTVNALPAAFTAPVGKGPLWWMPSQSVSLMDQVTRSMGTYQIDADGFIVPQGLGGENLLAASLVAGQPWTAIFEPFAPEAQPGADVGQRLNERQFAEFAVYVINSSGFLMAQLFSAKQTLTSPPLGTVMKSHRVNAYNQGDDATLPPTLRETVEKWPPPGASFDPRAAIIKDSPGPLLIAEIAMVVSI